MFWAFFSDGKDLVYRTSHNGSEWNKYTRTGIKTGPAAESVSIWHDSLTDEIFYSRQKHKDRILELGSGALESDGSASWSEPTVSVETRFPGQFPGTFVCARKHDDIWAGTTSLEREQNRHTEIWNFNGLRAKSVYDVDFGPRTAIRPPIILPTSSGILLIYGRTHHSDRLFITSTTDGTNWENPVSPAGNYCLGGAVVIGRRLFYCGPSEGALRFFTFGIDGKTPVNDSIIEPNNVVQATLATDGNSRLVTVYAPAGADCSIFYRLSIDLGTTWSERRTLVERESIAGFSLTSSKDIRNNEVGVLWSSGDKRPFKVRFGKIEI